MTESDDFSPGKLRERIEAGFREGDSVGAAARVHGERRRRVPVSVSPTLVFWDIERDESTEHFVFKPAPGSITLFWAPRGSELLRELTYAYLAHDRGRVEEVGRRAADLFMARELRTLSEAVEELVAAPVFFDLRYAGKTLAANLWPARDGGLGSLVFPYTGGELRPEDFVAVSYASDRRAELCDVLVVVCPPQLTDLERATLDAVPPAAREMFVASSVALIPTLAYLAVIAVAVITAATACCPAFHDRLSQLVLPPEMLEELGPALSVGELITLRSEIFEEFSVLG
jgi:hypothetical protein